MSANITPFDFHGNAVRVITDDDGNSWFVADEVCEILELSNTSQSVGRLDDDEKLTYTMYISGQNREVLLINESGLYSLIMTSRKPKAKEFKKWVTAEVLPSIRKTGSYSINHAIPQTLPEALRLAATALEERNAALQQIEQNRPKVKFAEVVTESGNTRCIRVWVKSMKHENNLIVGERAVFKWLLDNRYIFRDGNGYLPYARYEASGLNYFTVVIDEINGKPRRMLKITGKGVVALTGKVVAYFSNSNKNALSA